MFVYRLLGVAGIAVLCVLSAACETGPKKAKISGKVMIDGKPLEQGAISFSPVDGKTGTGGAPIANGTYSAELPLGSFRVSIIGSKVVGKKKVYDTADSPFEDVLAEAVPPKYNRDTTLKQDIAGDRNDVHFDLTTK
jgi:hypothetical protein